MRLIYNTILKLLPTRLFLYLQYRRRTGQKLNLKNPILYNEKLQWLKLHDKNKEYINLVDKYEVREYVKKNIGEEYLVPNYGVWNTPDEIPFNDLPEQFVLKCTHDSGGVFICNNKKEADFSSICNFLRKQLKTNHYYNSREWPYKFIKPRIIADELLIDNSEGGLKDYKIFCFNGEPKIIQVDLDRFTSHKRNFYSTEWVYQNFSIKYPSAPNIVIQKPQSLELMLDLAKKLSFDKIHVRVDFFILNNKIYFGELTFFHGSGCEQFTPPEWNKTFGDWIIIPKNIK